MMKKLLVLVLVLAMTSAAWATVTFEMRDGTDVVTEMTVGSSYVLYVAGASSDGGYTGGIYGDTYTAADWADVTQSNPQVLDTGDMSGINWNAASFGYDMVADDTGMGPGVSTGDWFSIDIDADSEGTLSLGLFDYAVSYYTPVASMDVSIIPEPMTIALLGLGGLFLRRRR
jgi:hypothetical protein